MKPVKLIVTRNKGIAEDTSVVKFWNPDSKPKLDRVSGEYRDHNGYSFMDQFRLGVDQTEQLGLTIKQGQRLECTLKLAPVTKAKRGNGR